ncbi:glycosyltransferase [Dokdonella sp. MW10]|uniref:glycosyltransferase n=1 Tax=Dokdonella sp. MW10 TaxID=2992926 RepID=UPI003F7D8D04
MHASAAPAIVHVVDTLETGGLERVVTDLALEQQARGHRVRVFSLAATQGFRAVLEAGGVPVVVGGKRGTLDLGVLRALRTACARADIVHTHNFVPNYYAALATLGMARIRLVNTCHNMGTRLAQRRLRWLYRASLARTARIALVGRGARDALVARGIVPASRAETVFNGVPVERYARTEASRAAAREALGIPSHVPLVGCVGRLVALKNHAAMLEAMPLLARAHPDVHLVLLGDGPLAAPLREQAAALGIASRVVFAGARSDIADLLPALDVFALPSRTEGLSIALLEACASRLAIVATAVGGNPEIVADGATGRLVPTDDASALATAVGALLADAGQRARFGAAARAWVEANASMQAMCARYDAVYAAALPA